jgi:tRNA U34 5-methylaminomethyl-2-thiouridine-forming methyltransferase MnmC/ADP-ribose pyrophosphatase YjhB (NUDIX family)
METGDADLRILLTADGSPTVELPGRGVTYHSRAGAVAESRHVFIGAGLEAFAATAAAVDPIDVLEIGFGTGLNAALALAWARAAGRAVRYRGLEPYPLPPSVGEELGRAYAPEAGVSGEEWAALHARSAEAPGTAPAALTSSFAAAVDRWTFAELPDAPESVDVVFQDAFAPEAAPELWTAEVFARCFRMLRPGGVLVTYCAKGAVRRGLEAAGFQCERLPGPPGKREMLRARKFPIERFNVRVYGLVYDPSGAHVLLVDEDLPGGRRTKFPGGGVEFGEGPEEALLRELREELGPGVAPAPAHGLRHLYTTGFFQRSIFRPSDQILSIYYTLRLPLDHPLPPPPAAFPGLEPGLHFRWHPRATLTPDLLSFPIDRFLLEQLQTGTLRPAFS